MVSKGPSSIQAEEVRFSALGHGRAKGLPMLCQELFLRYCLDLTEDTFQDFYHSTFPVFLSFAMERCALVKGMDLDPEEVVNRLYGILVAHAAGCRDRVPIKVLLSWCFGTINNIIKEELRFRSRIRQAPGISEPLVENRNALDMIIHKEDKENRRDLYNRVMSLIATTGNSLMEREKTVMRMFYSEGLLLRDIASRLGIRVEHAAVILFRARRRIARRIRQEDNRKPCM